MSALALRFRPPADASPGNEKSGSKQTQGASPKGSASTAGSTRAGGRRDAPGQRVYKIVEGKLTAIPVKTGISDATFTEVTSGEIAEGDKLVTRDLAGQGGPQSQIRLRMF